MVSPTVDGTPSAGVFAISTTAVLRLDLVKTSRMFALEGAKRNMTRSFGLDAVTALEALQASAARLRNDDLNEDLARDCACKAWQLCDHAFRALKGVSFGDLGRLQSHVRGRCAELAYLQDICIESKHGGISRYTPRIVAARFHRGAFSKDFSRDFNISRLEVELPDGCKMWFTDILDSAVVFWSHFFEEQNLG